MMCCPSPAREGKWTDVPYELTSGVIWPVPYFDYLNNQIMKILIYLILTSSFPTKNRSTSNQSWNYLTIIIQISGTIKAYNLFWTHIAIFVDIVLVDFSQIRIGLTGWDRSRLKLVPIHLYVQFWNWVIQMNL